MKGDASPMRARALALAAVRETFEEAGLLIGAPSAPAPAGGSVPSGSASTGSWGRFQSHGLLPRIGGLIFFARAITPPGRPRRYDTRFFCVEATAIARRIEVLDGELSSLDWFSFDAMRELDLPGITRVVIEDLAERLRAGLPGPAETPVPFYFHRGGSFERALLSHSTGPS
jgi:8-oxo-dGTP pyrophosphatase MutT (NUDIX family)